MTYEEWLSTEKRHANFAVAENALGYKPEGCVEVIEYSPGVILRLQDGSYFTHVGREDYAGTLDEVRVALWREYARPDSGY